MHMKHWIMSATALFVIVAIGSWLSRHFGWYNEYWFIDIALHVLSGIMFGYAWLAIAGRSKFSSIWVLTVGLISFATLASVLWEFWEFSGWRIMPSHTQFYFPVLSDTLGDLLSGMIGGVFLSIYISFKHKELMLKLPDA